MLKIRQISLVTLILLICVTAAPSQVSEIEETPREQTKAEATEPLLEENKDATNPSENVRQKRFYNYYGYGFPPINPLVYPNPPRSESSEVSGYGNEDPFLQIHRRLQDIASVVRQPAPPPPTSPFPIYLPVIFVPQYNCGCSPGNTNTTPRPSNGTTNQTNPDLFPRGPELEDERQNWGFIINEPELDDYEDDGNRPISFDPIKPIRPMRRPAPPVEHGSQQGQSKVMVTTTTTTPRPAVSNVLGSSFNGPFGPPRPPTNCDSAVLSCCHKPRVTYDCFVAQGCPNPTSRGTDNPCESKVVLRVIDKFKKYYGIRNGI